MGYKIKWAPSLLAAVGLILLLGVLLVSVSALGGVVSNTAYEPTYRGDVAYAAAPGSSGAPSTSDYSNTPSMRNDASSYWYYNPFENPLNSMLFVFLSIFAPLTLLIRLKEEQNAWKTILAGAAGVFFLSTAFIFAVGALQNMLSQTPSMRTSLDHAVGYQYGWLLMALVGGLIGAGLLYLAEQMRKKGPSKRSVYSMAAHVFGLALVIYTAAHVVVYSFTTVNLLKDFDKYNGTWTRDIVLNPIKLWGWLIFSAAMTFVAFKLLQFSKKSAPTDSMARYAYHTPASLGTAILLMGGITASLMFLYNLANALFPPYESYGSNLSGYELVLGLVFCAGAIWISRYLVDAQMKTGVQRTGHYWLIASGAIIVLVSLLCSVFALYSMLTSSSHTSKLL